MQLNPSYWHPKKWVFFCTLLYVILILFTCFTNVVHASEITDSAILKTLKEYEIDSITSIAGDAMRDLGYLIIKGLGAMVDGLYGAIGGVYKLLSFSSSTALAGLLGRYSFMYKIIFTISITFFGIFLILGKHKDQLNTVNCLIAMILIIAAMPLFTSQISKLTIAGSDYARNQWVKTADGTKIDSIASSVFLDNIVDLKKVDKNISGTTIKGLKKDHSFHSLKLGKKDWRYLNINTPLDYDEDDLKNDLWNQQIAMEYEGKYVLSDMDSWHGIGDSYYYRYQVISWFNIIILLLVVVIVFAFASIKCALLVWNVAQSMIYTPFVAVTDLASGQRTKEAIRGFLSLFLAIFLCVALLGLYFVGFSFANKIDNFYLKLIMHIALAWATIDGPNQIERIFGVDIGIKSGWQMILGASAAGGVAASAGRNAAKAVGGAAKVGAAAANLFSGKDKMDETKDKVKNGAASSSSEASKKATDGKSLLGHGGSAKDQVRSKDKDNGGNVSPNSKGGVEPHINSHNGGVERKSNDPSTAVKGGTSESKSQRAVRNPVDRSSGNLSRTVSASAAAAAARGEVESTKNQTAYDALRKKEDKK